MQAGKKPKIEAFHFQVGRVLAGKYEVERLLGSGWEGEVYKVVEGRTGIPRAAKLFFPHRNERDRAVKQYHSFETVRHRGHHVACLISEYVEGELLEDLIERQPGGRLTPFEALHLVHDLSVGLEQIHQAREYHGDIHPSNVLVRRRGVSFDLKLVDFYRQPIPKAENIREDIVSVIHLLYQAVGGRRRYGSAPEIVKKICLGLRRDLITRKFPTAGHLRRHLESFAWPGV
jgi:tRNA A-37 threonylcarbamoyl transferase component Bud32